MALYQRAEQLAEENRSSVNSGCGAHEQGAGISN